MFLEADWPGGSAGSLWERKDPRTHQKWGRERADGRAPRTGLGVAGLCRGLWSRGSPQT